MDFAPRHTRAGNVAEPSAGRRENGRGHTSALRDKIRIVEDSESPTFLREGRKTYGAFANTRSSKTALMRTVLPELAGNVRKLSKWCHFFRLR